jgi:hypothetical protein
MLTSHFRSHISTMSPPTLPLGSTSLLFLIDISLVGVTYASGGLLGYSKGNQTTMGIWYVWFRYEIGMVP